MQYFEMMGIAKLRMGGFIGFGKGTSAPVAR
jgi:hypothetical protein